MKSGNIISVIAPQKAIPIQGGKVYKKRGKSREFILSGGDIKD
jgi:hypothetical protein